MKQQNQMPTAIFPTRNTSQTGVNPRTHWLKGWKHIGCSNVAIAELDAIHRAVFLLRDVEDLSIRDTAKVLGISAANVKVRLLRARMQLRERLTRVFGDKKSRYKPADHSHGLTSGHILQEKTHD